MMDNRIKKSLMTKSVKIFISPSDENGKKSSLFMV